MTEKGAEKMSKKPPKKSPNNMGDFDVINEVVDEATAESSLHIFMRSASDAKKSHTLCGGIRSGSSIISSISGLFSSERSIS